MSEIIVNMSGLGKFTMTLDLVDPCTDETNTEVWQAKFCDDTNDDCQIVFFEIDNDYEAWDIIDAAIQTYRDEKLPDENLI
jgi:hypothetical protein